jgi:hypothetical protein
MLLFNIRYEIVAFLSLGGVGSVSTRLHERGGRCVSFSSLTVEGISIFGIDFCLAVLDLADVARGGLGVVVLDIGVGGSK